MDKFRHQLRKEAKLWYAEGLIDDSVYQQLKTRYQLDALEKAASDRFVAVLLGLGGILIGLGAIAFVAANWQAWSREIRVLLLLSLFLGVNAGGFYLWRTPVDNSLVSGTQTWRQRLGQSLLLLGALILGANLGLMSQMFHLSGSVYELFLVWGLGVTLMAYSLQMTALGVMAVILMAIAYWSGVGELFRPGETTVFRLLLGHFPLVMTQFVVLAYWCQSKGIFGLAVIVLIPALTFNTALLPALGLPVAMKSCLAIALPPLLLWGYDDLNFPIITSRLFQPLARTLAIVFLSLVFYWCAFNWFWLAPPGSTSGNQGNFNQTFGLDIVILGILALWEWVQLAKPERKRLRRWRLDSTSSTVGGFIVVTVGVFLWHINVYPIPTLATFLMNVQLFLLAAGLIRVGLAKGLRGCFWWGMILLILQIMSRMLEYNTALLLKSFVFVLCGVGAIAAGLWFERHFSRKTAFEEDEA